jgi:glycosyltransferase involved in cell wall biosynthesis
MAPLVTIGIPFYKRMTTLADALRSVAAQDYPAIELIISDNGQNGDALQKLVEENYTRPFRIHRHPVTVSPASNFNTVLELASGAYFTLLCDDDELSPDFVSELVGLLEAHPQAILAVPQHAKMDGNRMVYWKSTTQRPECMQGDDFLRAWTKRKFDLASSTVTHLARTVEMRRIGGYPEFARAVHSDDAVWVQLSIGHDVVMGQRATFYWRVEESSTGHAADHRTLAQAVRAYVAFLKNSTELKDFARAYPKRGARLWMALLRGSSNHYFYLWNSLYRKRLGRWEWYRAAFLLKFEPHYYRQVLRVIFEREIYKRFIARYRKALMRRLYRVPSGCPHPQ